MDTSGANSTWVVFTALVLISIELLRSLPSWLRVKRLGSTDGLSATSLAILAGSFGLWLLVAFDVRSVAVLLGTLTWFVFHTLLCWLYFKLNAGMRLRFLVVLISTLVIEALVLISAHTLGQYETALALLLAIVTAAYSIPALLAGLRSSTTAGLSLIYLALNTVEGILYTAGGSGLGGIAQAGQWYPSLLLFGALALLTNVPRLLRVGHRRLRGQL